MNKRLTGWLRWVQIVVASMLAILARADNPCVETGPHVTIDCCPSLPSGVSCKHCTEYIYYDCPANQGGDTSFPIPAPGSPSDGGDGGSVTVTPLSLTAPPVFPLGPGTYPTPIQVTYNPPSGEPIIGVYTQIVMVPQYKVAQLINFNYSGQATPAKLGYAATGIFTNDYWNYVGPHVRIYTEKRLLTADRQYTSTSLTISNFVNSRSDGAPDAMYGTRLSGRGAPMTLTVSNLPPGTNMIFIYSPDGVFDVISGKNDYGVRTCFDPQPASPLYWWIEGKNYTLFTNVVSYDETPVVITVSPGTLGNSLISGLQIVTYINTNRPLTIISPPVSQTVYEGDTATFTAFASSSPVQYQWYLDDNPISDTPVISGSQSDTLTLHNTRLDQAGNYTVKVSNSNASILSAPALLTVIVNPPCAAPPSGLMAWWRAEGNADDSAGGNDGILSGGAEYSTGEVGHAFSLDGVTGYVEVLASDTLDVGTGAGFTIEGWIWPTNVDLERPIVEWNDDQGDYGVHFWISAPCCYGGGPGSLYANIVDTDGYYHFLASPAGLIVTNCFQHVAVTYDTATGIGTLYVNGAVVAQQSMGIFTPETEYDLYLGARILGYAQATRWPGKLDEISIYNRALSAAEIAGVYSAGISGKCDTAIPPLVVTQPVSLVALVGDNITMVAAASGTEPLYYQWNLNGNPIPGANSDTLSLNDVLTNQAGLYTVRIGNTAGSVTSHAALLSVLSPTITGPFNQNVTYGQSVTFGAQVNIEDNVHYQWRERLDNETFVNVGADSSTYTILKPTVADSGRQFEVVVTIGNYVQTSRLAVLSVTPAIVAISADDQTRAQGEPNGTLTYTITGLVAGDTQSILSGLPSITLSSGADADSPVGTYTISVSGDVSCANYTINYDNGFLNVINKASSTVGTDFWMAFPYTKSQLLSAFISGTVDGTVGNLSTLDSVYVFSEPFAVDDGAVANPDIDVGTLRYGIPETNGIHVTADHPVGVSGMYSMDANSTAFEVYPTNMLGTYYCLMAHASDDDRMDCSQFAIVATEDGTAITIIPSATASLGTALQPVTIGGEKGYQVTLDRGRTYQLGSIENRLGDVTGTIIQSSKPIAVFAGASEAFVPGVPFYAANPLIAEQLPVSCWSKQALGFPLAGRANGDSYRVLAAEDDTQIQINGMVVATLGQGQYYDTVINGPAEFVGSKPIQVAQFATGGFWDEQMGSDPSIPQVGDPFEMLLPPAGHYLKEYAVATPTGFSANYVNLIVEQAGIDSVYVDEDQILPDSFRPIASSGYYGVQVPVPAGVHDISCSQPIGVEMYGFGEWDAYGYIGGITNFTFVAVPDVASVPLDTTVTIDVLKNDIFSSRADLTLSVVRGAASGEAAVQNQQILYTPNPGYSGKDQITYQITEGAYTSTATVTLWVNNRPPTANNLDVSDLCSSSPNTFGILNSGAVSDPDGDPLSVLSVGGAQFGSVMLNSDGTVTYTRYSYAWPWWYSLLDDRPIGGVGDSDSFTYTVTDGRGGTASAIVRLTMNQLVAKDINVTAVGGETTPIDVMNYIQPSIDPSTKLARTWWITDIPHDRPYGKVVGTDFIPNSNNTEPQGLDYAFSTSLPNNFPGYDSFTYTVTDGHCSSTATITVAVQVPPVITQQPQSATVEEGGDVSFAVQVTGAAPWTFDWYFNGCELGGIGSGSRLYMQGVTIAQAGTYQVVVGNPYGKAVSLAVKLTVVPQHGVTTANNEIFQIPENNGPSPLNILAGGADSEGLPLIIFDVASSTDVPYFETANGSGSWLYDWSSPYVYYQPNPGFFGYDFLDYNIQNLNGRAAQATAAVFVNKSGNRNPTARDLTETLPTGQPSQVDATVTFDVLDPASSLRIVSLGDNSIFTTDPPKKGSVRVDGKQLTYTRNGLMTGYDIFHYVVTDGNGGYALGKMTINQAWVACLTAIPGYRQVYLYWQDDPTILNYDVYYTTSAAVANATAFNLADWTPAPNGAGLISARYWHENLQPGTTYYYIVVAHFDPSDSTAAEISEVISESPSAGVSDPGPYIFTPQTVAYNGMVFVEWKVPKKDINAPDVINQTDWQFFVERKMAGLGDTAYELLSDTGYGLSYLDTDVTNGQSYIYRVTAFDSATYYKITVVARNADNGLIAWWAADGNAYDMINGLNGTLQGPTTYAAGKIGQAFSFNGLGSSVNVTSPSPLLNPGAQATVTAWMRYTPAANNETYEGVVASDFYMLELSNACIYAYVTNADNGGAGAGTNVGGADVSDGRWHHVAFTYDGTQVQLYFDGQPHGNPSPFSEPISPMASGSFMAIGSEDGRSSYPDRVGHAYFHGLIDDVTLYNRALSPAEVQMAYNITGNPDTDATTPSASDAFTLLPPVPGNGYVSLTWCNLRASEYDVQCSTSRTGTFTTIATLTAPDAYDNPTNSYCHTGLQNGVTYWYRVVATLPINNGGQAVQTDSDVKSAMPLASLAPLPPDGFDAQIAPGLSADDAAGRILLSWNPSAGAVGYELFQPAQGSLAQVPSYNGTSTGCSIDVPNGTVPGTVFSFQVCSVNGTGVASAMSTTTIIYQQPVAAAENTDNEIVLEVAGWIPPDPTTPDPANTLYVNGPTNLALTAQVNVPNVQQVTFYALNNDTEQQQVIGSAETTPFQTTWFQAPQGNYTITAVAVAGGSPYQPGNSYSASASVDVTLQPQLAAYNASATDLQLPAPGLPITLCRSYNSQDTASDGSHLAVGWTASWKQSALSLTADLGSGWAGVEQTCLGSQYYFIAAQSSHLVTITLPDGESLQFAAQICNSYDAQRNPTWDPTVDPFESELLGDDDENIFVTFQPFMVNQGTLNYNGNLSLTYDPDTGDEIEGGDWDGLDIGFNPIPMSQFTYTASDGTQYAFGQQGQDVSTWLLTQITDRNYNTLTYSYNDSGQVSRIASSNGRSVSFSYHGSEIDVFDPFGQNSPAVIKYILNGNQQLAQVRQLTDRTANPPVYVTTTYSYGAAGNDLNRLTEVYDTRGVRAVGNTYDNEGHIQVQTNAAGDTTAYKLAQNNTQLTVTKTTIAGGQLTAQVQYNDSGSISGATQPQNGLSPSGTLATQNTYDENGLLTSQTDANGNKTTFSYDSQNRLVGQTDPLGNNTSTLLNGFGQVNISIDANGNEASYTYDGNGNTTDSYDTSGNHTQSTYTSVNNGQYAGGLLSQEVQIVSAVSDPIVTLNTYDGTDTIVGDLIETIQGSQDGNGNFIGLASTNYFQYDPDGNLINAVKVRTTNGLVEFISTQTTYDAQRRVTDTQVFTGGSSSGPWNAVANTHTRVSYNSMGKTASTVDGYNRVTTYRYDVSGNLVETVYPDDTVARTAYDAYQRPYIVQDRAIPTVAGPGASETVGPATMSSYDASGRVTNVIRLASVTLTESQANAPVALAGAEDPFTMVPSNFGTTLTTNFTFYDAAGRVQYTVDARGTITENDYDAAGRRVADKVYTGFSYSGRGPVSISPGASFNQTGYAYDPNGNRVAVTDALGHTTTSVYDAANRVIETIFPATSANGVVSNSTAYDGLGRKTSVTDEADVSTAYVYDFRGLLMCVTVDVNGANQATTVYTNDEVGNVVSQTDANNHTTTFQYDALGRRTVRTLPDGAAESFANTGVPETPGSTIQVLQTTHTDFTGRQTVVVNDRMERMATKQLPAITHVSNGDPITDFPATTVAYTYDALNSQPAQIVQSGGYNRTVRYAYDALNRLRVKDTPEGTLTYLYDALGTVTNISAQYTYTGWAAAPPYSFELLTRSAANSARANCSYAYDQLGRLKKVNPDSTGNGADAIYAYDPVGNLQSLAFRNGQGTTYTYNERNWLQLVQTLYHGSPVAQYDYDNAAGGAAWPAAQRLSAVGQRRQVSELGNHVIRSVAYGYDDLRRLTSESITANNGPSGTVRYDVPDAGNSLEGYDLVGNRQSRIVTGNLPVSSYSGNVFDSRDRVNVGTLGAPNPQFDLNGNTTLHTVGGQTMVSVYDAENHLVSQSGNGSTVTLVYDADGNRVGKTVGTTATSYLVDDKNPSGYAQVLEERDGSGNTSVSYVYGLSIISQNRAGVVSYYGQDGSGSVRYLADASGGVTDTYVYDAFGIQIYAIGNSANNYRYTGQQWDGDLGMYYLRARYYSPTMGRFWTMDSYEGNNEDPLSLHKYLYCQGNPVNGSDPTGFWVEIPSNFSFGRDAEAPVVANFYFQRPYLLASKFSVHGWMDYDSLTGYSGVGRLVPDLVDDQLNEIYDVKSDGELLAGMVKVQDYRFAFNMADPDPVRAQLWHAGTTYNYNGVNPVLLTTKSMGKAVYAVYFPTVAGVIPYKLYRVDDDQDRKTIPIPVFDAVSVPKTQDAQSSQLAPAYSSGASGVSIYLNYYMRNHAVGIAGAAFTGLGVMAGIAALNAMEGAP